MQKYEFEMHGKIVSKDPFGISVVEIAVNDDPKAVSTCQKQLDMTHGAAGTARISSAINFTRSLLPPVATTTHNTGLVTLGLLIGSKRNQNRRRLWSTND